MGEGVLAVLGSSDSDVPGWFFCLLGAVKLPDEASSPLDCLVCGHALEACLGELSLESPDHLESAICVELVRDVNDSRSVAVVRELVLDSLP